MKENEQVLQEALVTIAERCKNSKNKGADAILIAATATKEEVKHLNEDLLAAFPTGKKHELALELVAALTKVYDISQINEECKQAAVSYAHGIMKGVATQDFLRNNDRDVGGCIML